MKKLLAFIVILSLAATANAYFNLYLNDSPAPDSVEILVDEILTFQIYGGEPSRGWLGYIIVEDGGVGSFGNHWPTEAAGGLAEHTAYSYPGWGAGYEFTTAQSGSPSDVEDGIQHIFEYSSSGVGTAVVSLWDDAVGYDEPVGALNITVVPEPCTVLLLGLGVVILRRRGR